MEKPKPWQKDEMEFYQYLRDVMNEVAVRVGTVFEDAEKIKTENSEELADLRCKLMAREDSTEALLNTNEALKNALNDKYRLQDRVEQLESGFRGWLRRLWAKGGE